MFRILLICTTAIVTACAGRTYPVTSPYYQIPTGSHLILKQTLAILPNVGRVHIQYGKIINNGKIDQYYPHCWFVTWKISPAETIIHPDEFIVTSSKKYESYVYQNRPLMFARRGGPFDTGMSAGATAIEYFTELMIHSGKQPDIRQFICNHWEDPADARHLTVAEINKALGDVAELKPLGN